jgi:hypothetical protein
MIAGVPSKVAVVGNGCFLLGRLDFHWLQKADANGCLHVCVYGHVGLGVWCVVCGVWYVVWCVNSPAVPEVAEDFTFD